MFQISLILDKKHKMLHNVGMENLYYLDNAATTKVFDEEFEIIKKCNETFYNPSASYKQAIEVKKNLDNARENICKLLHGQNGKLIFTSSATESNNTVFFGLHLRAGNEVLISKGEHPAVYRAAHRLEKNGIIVKDIPLASNGKVDFEEFKKLVNKNVVLISVMHVSNETGAINDIKKLCGFAKTINPKIIFHSDGVQAFGKINVNLLNLGVDLYSISAHKIYAPRGIAGLWIKNGIVIDPMLIGGGQENDFRSSTENVSGALAFSYAAEKVVNELNKNYELICSFKAEFIKKIQNSNIKQFVKINSTDECSPYIISLSFENIKGEVLVHALEDDGILISTGSACSSKKAGNRTLDAMGKNESEIIGSVRLSFSPYEKYDFDKIVDSFEKNVLRFEKNVLQNK